MRRRKSTFKKIYIQDTENWSQKLCDQGKEYSRENKQNYEEAIN